MDSENLFSTNTTQYTEEEIIMVIINFNHFHLLRMVILLLGQKKESKNDIYLFLKKSKKIT